MNLIEKNSKLQEKFLFIKIFLNKFFPRVERKQRYCHLCIIQYNFLSWGHENLK